MPTQGFSWPLLGRRTRSLGRGGKRVGASLVEAPFGDMVRVPYLKICHRRGMLAIMEKDSMMLW